MGANLGHIAPHRGAEQTLNRAQRGDRKGRDDQRAQIFPGDSGKAQPVFQQNRAGNRADGGRVDPRQEGEKGGDDNPHQRAGDVAALGQPGPVEHHQHDDQR